MRHEVEARGQELEGLRGEMAAVQKAHADVKGELAELRDSKRVLEGRVREYAKEASARAVGVAGETARMVGGVVKELREARDALVLLVDEKEQVEAVVARLEGEAAESVKALEGLGVANAALVAEKEALLLEQAKGEAERARLVSSQEEMRNGHSLEAQELQKVQEELQREVAEREAVIKSLSRGEGRSE